MREKKPCHCGRGYIEYDEKTGISLYSVWLESSSFGRPEYGDCCKKCKEDQYRELQAELEI